MSKKFFSVILCILILVTCSCNRSSLTVVYLDTNKVVVYDNLHSACSSGQSIGKNISEIIPDLGEGFVYFQDHNICLKVKVRKEHLITNQGVSDAIIDVYELPGTSYFLRITK